MVWKDRGKRVRALEASLGLPAAGSRDDARAAVLMGLGALVTELPPQEVEAALESATEGYLTEAAGTGETA